MPIGLTGALLAGSAISGGASLLGGIMGSDAAQKAADEQAASQAQALQAQQAMFKQGYDLVQPYAAGGLGAFNQLSNLYGIPYSNAAGTSAGGQAVANQAMGNFTNTPDYRFAFSQGLQALDRSAASRGNLMSGGQVKGAQEFGQGLASQQFSNYFNRLLSLGQMGSQAAGTALGGSVSALGPIGNTISSIGATQAAGTIGSANSLVGGLQGAGNAISQGLTLPSILQAFSRNPPPTQTLNPGVSPQSGYQPNVAPVSSPLNWDNVNNGLMATNQWM